MDFKLKWHGVCAAGHDGWKKTKHQNGFKKLFHKLVMTFHESYIRKEQVNFNKAIQSQEIGVLVIPRRVFPLLRLQTNVISMVLMFLDVPGMVGHGIAKT